MAATGAAGPGGAYSIGEDLWRPAALEPARNCDADATDATNGPFGKICRVGDPGPLGRFARAGGCRCRHPARSACTWIRTVGAAFRECRSRATGGGGRGPDRPVVSDRCRCGAPSSRSRCAGRVRPGRFDPGEPELPPIPSGRSPGRCFWPDTGDRTRHPVVAGVDRPVCRCHFLRRASDPGEGHRLASGVGLRRAARTSQAV